MDRCASAPKLDTFAIVCITQLTILIRRMHVSAQNCMHVHSHACMDDHFCCQNRKRYSALAFRARPHWGEINNVKDEHSRG